MPYDPQVEHLITEARDRLSDRNIKASPEDIQWVGVGYLATVIEAGFGRIEQAIRANGGTKSIVISKKAAIAAGSAVGVAIVAAVAGLVNGYG